MQRNTIEIQPATRETQPAAHLTQPATRDNPGIRDWRLRPDTPVLACGPGSVQFGLDRRWALRLGGLSDAEIRWLQVAARKQSQPSRAARNHGIGQSRAIEICATLARSGFLVPPSTSNAPVMTALARTQKGDGTMPQRHIAGGATDAPALSALRPDGDGNSTLARRALARVAITDTGRLGAQVALLLAAAGVGHLQLPDTSAVTAHDIGPFTADDAGKPRDLAIRRRLTAQGLRPKLGLRETPHLTISIESGTQGAAYFGTLQQMVVPHLAVALGEAEVEVGPFVLPGRSTCIHCLQLLRAGADEHWGDLLTSICALAPRPVETLLAAAASSVITAQTLAFIDGATPSLVNALATIALPDITPDIVPLLPNPTCGCVTLPPALPAPLP